MGTLVERTSRLILLVKIKNATAEAALEGFSKAFARIPLPLRQTLTYDQGREMACHKALSEETGLKSYFADPRSPWQRGTNENSNGLIRQFLPKGANLNHFQEEDLALFEWLLNTRPRLMHNDRTPEEVYTELVDATRNTMPDNDNQPLHLVLEITVGYTFKSLGAGMWALLHAPSFEDGLLDVIHAGGDADTNAAVAGAVLGARFGIRTIPARW